ncbi:MAG TPA: serine hydrolase domain-containing protein [Verrucomicrobiales bacterium]|nr:serine hydrolase domain-containing protein [Verrucomicrobiales bacterium]
MTRRSSLPCALALALGFGFPGISSPSRSSPPRFDDPGAPARVDAYIESALRAWNVPGAAVVLVTPGETLLCRGYGTRRAGADEPVDDSTLFSIASNTKAFTAAALGILASEGRLDWDDRVADRLPWFQLAEPETTRKLTIRDCLCHRAGLPLWGGDLLWWNSRYDRAEVLRRLRYLEPAYDFRAGYAYNNLLFVAAGEIIPAVAEGESWETFVRSRLFVPLGMRRTTATLAEASSDPNFALGHTLRDGVPVTVSLTNADTGAAAGAIVSCARDFVPWLKLHLNDGRHEGRVVVPSAALSEMRRPHTLIPFVGAERKLFPMSHFYAYGLGLFLRDFRGQLLTQHGGALDGMFSYVSIAPGAGIAAAVFTNRDHHRLAMALTYYLLDHFLADAPEDWSQRFLDAAPAPAKSTHPSPPGRDPGGSLPAGLDGTYQNTFYGEASIASSAGRAILTLSAHPDFPAEIVPLPGGSIHARFADPVFGSNPLSFELGEDGRVAAFRIRVRPDWVDTVSYRFERKE